MGERNDRCARRRSRLAAAMLAIGLSACSTDVPRAPLAATPPASAPPVAPQPDIAASPTEPLEAKSEMYPGTGSFVHPAPAHREPRTTVGEQGDITLNFINTDVKDVAKAVLGDYLKLNYEIGANVQGTVTIQTSQPLSRAQVLPVLEQALRLNGMAVVENRGIYKVVPMSDAQNVARVTAPGRQNANIGYGIDIVPVHYVGAAEMAKLLEPIAPTAGIVHVDAARNVLIIEGTAEERQTLRDDVALFDADWLKGMSFAIFTPNYTDAEELTKELNQVLGGLNSPVAGLMQLVPIQRLNAVLAISAQPKYLEQLRAWVNRLDRPGQGSDKRIYVYNVQNGRASDLAGTLGKLLFGSSGNTAGRSNRDTSTSSQSPSTATDKSASPLTGSGSAATTAEAVSVSGTAAGIGSLSITADETNNALAILATPQQYGVLEAALRKLDASPLQVLLEAAIVEVTLTNDIKYGVQYFFQPDSQNQIVLTDSASASVVPALPGFSYLFSNGSNIRVVLDALQAVTHIEVVSSPEVMVLNNQTANLEVGDRVPIVTAQAVATENTNAPIVNSVEYEDTGVILKVTPRVNRGGMVMMDIDQEVSQVTTTTSSTIQSPTIQQRKISSSVAVQDGETIALGGLISDSRDQSRTGIPYLEEIPVLGNLFRDTGNKVTRTELMVLITPHVVDDVKKARKVTDELRHKLPQVQAVLERAN